MEYLGFRRLYNAWFARLTAHSATRSLPPSYKLYSKNHTDDQQLRHHIARLTRLEAFYRSNPGAVIHEFYVGEIQRMGGKTGSMKIHVQRMLPATIYRIFT